MSRLTADLFDITELAHHGPEDIFISGVTIVGALAIMFTIQWQLALVIACIIPVFFLVVWKCRKSMQDASIKVKQRTATINAEDVYKRQEYGRGERNMSRQDVLALLREQEGAFVSGEEISHRLGLSRAAIWKAVDALRREGYTVEEMCIRDRVRIEARSSPSSR